MLGDKLTKFYDKSCELDRLSEDIIKYVLDADKVIGALDKAKAALRPIEHKLADSIKKFEVNYWTKLNCICKLKYFNKFNQLINNLLPIINCTISDNRS